MNPPSAWAVAKRDNPNVAANCWTHPVPKGPNGRFVGQLPQFYGLWKFSKNKAAAKDLLLYISQKESIAQLVEASVGYDLPSFKTMYDLDTWKKVEPPVGTVYGYPPRGDEQTSMFGAPARSEVGAQMYNQAINTVMISKFTQGKEKLDDVIKWAEKELEGTLARLSVEAPQLMACRPLVGRHAATCKTRGADQRLASRHGRHRPIMGRRGSIRTADAPVRRVGLQSLHAAAIDHRAFCCACR